MFIQHVERLEIKIVDEERKKWQLWRPYSLFYNKNINDIIYLFKIPLKMRNYNGNND